MPVATDFVYHDGLQVVTTDGWPAPPFQHCLMALEEGRITLRDISILRELAYSQFLTRNQIHALVLKRNVSKSVVKRRLEVMSNLGLVAQVRWDDPQEDGKAIRRVAYALASNGARLLRHHFGRSLPWKPGTAQRHLKRVLSVLAANEFRIQVMDQNPEVIQDWHIHTFPVGPVARFLLGGQLILLEVPRDLEDAWDITPQRYLRWEDENPVIFVLAPNEKIAGQVYRQLKDDIPTDRILFSTDDRAFSAAIDDPGFVWQWEPSGQAIPLALV